MFLSNISHFWAIAALVYGVMEVEVCVGLLSRAVLLLSAAGGVETA